MAGFRVRSQIGSMTYALSSALPLGRRRTSRPIAFVTHSLWTTNKRRASGKREQTARTQVDQNDRATLLTLGRGAATSVGLVSD